ncbi:ABC transporter permease [Sphaerobacter sp.]|uniref:ABC transporter permease n=1 Tax=Sphaerobacter sp. TaxID=2099654 RepID=UPI001D7DEA45|nr:ABC transporter permease [Sphaerobacter sp.]MBX5443678.1 ABC transporter permease [Sphaerobacter sp.]
MSALSESLRAGREPAVQSVWARRFGVFWRSWETRISTLLLLVMIGVALVPTSVWPDTAFDSNLTLRHREPGLLMGTTDYLFGADALGRDVFFRILMGTKLTLLIAGLATLFATIIGSAAGLCAAYFRGWVDMVVSRLVDIMLAFPILLLVLALVAALGQSVSSVIIVLALSGWAGYARVIRSATLSLVEREFVEAARCTGARSGHILLRHLLPNVASPILVLSTLNLASFILTESSVSFLGLGPQPPAVTWGALIGDGRNYMYDAWWATLFPGLAIILTVLAFNLVGDAMRDAFDPHTRQ